MAVTVVRARPRRLRQLCWVAAPLIVVGCVGLAASMGGATGGGGSLRAGDRVALVGVGVLLAVGILTLARPRVEADERHIVVRNLFGSHDLTWDLVEAVRVGKGAPWASLELADDEKLPVMAVQAIDKEYALAALTAMRALLAQSRRPDDERRR